MFIRLCNFPEKLKRNSEYKLTFSIASDSKSSSSRSRCIGSEPGIHENLAELEMSSGYAQK